MTAAFWPTQLALLGIIPPAEVTCSETDILARVLCRWHYTGIQLNLLATKAPPLKHRIPTSVLTGRTSELTSVLTGRTNS